MLSSLKPIRASSYQVVQRARRLCQFLVQAVRAPPAAGVVGDATAAFVRRPGVGRPGRCMYRVGRARSPARTNSGHDEQPRRARQAAGSRGAARIRRSSPRRACRSGVAPVRFESERAIGPGQIVLCRRVARSASRTVIGAVNRARRSRPLSSRNNRIGRSSAISPLARIERIRASASNSRISSSATSATGPRSGTPVQFATQAARKDRNRNGSARSRPVLLDERRLDPDPVVDCPAVSSGFLRHPVTDAAVRVRHGVDRLDEPRPTPFPRTSGSANSPAITVVGDQPAECGGRGGAPARRACRPARRQDPDIAPGPPDRSRAKVVA